MSDENYFIKLNGVKHRLLVIEYLDDKPHSVITEEHWEHSKKPWFREGVHTTSGTCCCDFDFNFSKAHDTIYWHKSGCGGDRSLYVIGKLSNGARKIWLAPDIKLATHVAGDQWNWGAKRELTAAEIAEYGYSVLEKPISENPFAGACGDIDCVYCPRCESYLPDDFNILSGLCEHAQWCDDCSAWVLDDTRELIGVGEGKCDHEI